MPKSRKKLLLMLSFLGGMTGGFLLDLYLQYSEQKLLAFSRESLLEIAASTLMGGLLGGALYLLYHLLNKKLPWAEQFGARFIATFISFVFLALFISWAGSRIFRFLLLGDFSFATLSFTDPVLKLMIITVFSGFVYTIVEFALYSYHRYAQLQIEAVQQDQARLALQYDLLQSQLSPHYLFNGLNTISSLVYSDPELAVRYIRNFAQTYQYLLRTSPEPLVSLKEEVEFVRTYVFLLQVRFGGNLQLEVSLPEALLATVLPPLTLQLLVENAVKHNVVSAGSPLLIRIYSEHGDFISVTNTVAPKEEQPTSHQMGLSNISQRYGYFTSQPVQVESKEQFEVKLPVLFPAGIRAQHPHISAATPLTENERLPAGLPLTLAHSS